MQVNTFLPGVPLPPQCSKLKPLRMDAKDVIRNSIQSSKDKMQLQACIIMDKDLYCRKLMNPSTPNRSARGQKSTDRLKLLQLSNLSHDEISRALHE